MDTSTQFSRYLRFRSTLEDPFVELDLSHSAMAEADVETLRPDLAAALAAMRALEGGSVANADELARLADARGFKKQNTTRFCPLS